MAVTINNIIQGWVDAQQLTTEEKKVEKELRPQLIVSWSNVRSAKYEMGRLVSEYRRHFRGVYKSLYHAIDIEEKTARNYLHGYQRASAVSEPLRQAAFQRGCDLAQKRWEGLTKALAAHKDTPASNVAGVVDEEIKRAKAAKKVEGQKKNNDLPLKSEPSYDDQPSASKAPANAQDAKVGVSITRDEPIPSTALTDVESATNEQLSGEVRRLKIELLALVKDEAKMQAIVDRHLIGFLRSQLGSSPRKKPKSAKVALNKAA